VRWAIDNQVLESLYWGCARPEQTRSYQGEVVGWSLGKRRFLPGYQRHLRPKTIRNPVGRDSWLRQPPETAKPVPVQKSVGWGGEPKGTETGPALVSDMEKQKFCGQEIGPHSWREKAVAFANARAFKWVMANEDEGWWFESGQESSE